MTKRSRATALLSSTTPTYAPSRCSRQVLVGDIAGVAERIAEARAFEPGAGVRGDSDRQRDSAGDGNVSPATKPLRGEVASNAMNGFAT